jgi:hypothetical protein
MARRIITVTWKQCIQRNMQPICTHKICLQSSTPSHAYPITRLPRECKALAGKKAQIYQTEQEGELVFVVKVDKLVDKSCLPKGETVFDSRRSALETKVQSLEDELIADNELFCSKNEKEVRTEGRGRDSNRRRGLHRAVFEYKRQNKLFF